MSATSNPIPPDRFATAIVDLDLGALFAKAAEIRNSIAHLRQSNDQMAEFVTSEASESEMREYGGDPVLIEAMKENEEVILRMEERVELIKLEVEARGVRWVEPGSEAHGREDEETNGTNGDANGTGTDGVHL